MVSGKDWLQRARGTGEVVGPTSRRTSEAVAIAGLEGVRPASGAAPPAQRGQSPGRSGWLETAALSFSCSACWLSCLAFGAHWLSAVVAAAADSALLGPPDLPRTSDTGLASLPAGRRLLRKWPGAPARRLEGTRPNGSAGSRTTPILTPAIWTCSARVRCSSCSARPARAPARIRLAAWLLHAAAPEEIRARQAAVAELRPLLDLREDLALLGGDVPAGVDFNALAAWGAEPPLLTARWPRWAALGLGLLTTTALAGWLLTLFGLLDDGTAFGAFFLQARIAAVRHFAGGAVGLCRLVVRPRAARARRRRAPRPGSRPSVERAGASGTRHVHGTAFVRVTRRPGYHSSSRRRTTRSLLRNASPSWAICSICSIPGAINCSCRWPIC